MTARIETSYLGGTPNWMCKSRVSTTLLLKATQNESNRTQKETPKLGARVFRRKTAVYLRVNGSLLASGRLDDIAQAVTRRQTQ